MMTCSVLLIDPGTLRQVFSFAASSPALQTALRQLCVTIGLGTMFMVSHIKYQPVSIPSVPERVAPALIAFL